MQNRKKRIRILTNNEISELYQIPSFNSAEMELSADSFLDKHMPNMTTIIIGTTVVDYRTMTVDTSPFPEHNSGYYLAISGVGIVFSGKERDDGIRCQSGVIESHYSTADWQLVLSSYKKWLTEKGKRFSYIFVLLGGELVHHEINASELI